MVRKRKTVLISSESEEEEETKTNSRPKRRRTTKSDAKKFLKDKEFVDDDYEDEVEDHSDDEEPEEQTNSRLSGAEINAAQESTLGGLKQLLEVYMYNNIDTITVYSIGKFLNPFHNALTEHYKMLRPTVVENVKKERQQLIAEKTKSLQKIAKLESTLKSDMEFMSDPALLQDIFSYLDLSSMLVLRKCCRYFKQFIQTNFSKIVSHLNLHWETNLAKVSAKMDRIALTIQQKRTFKQLCVLAQEQYAISAIAAYEVKLGRARLMHGQIFDDLFYKTAAKFTPYIWLKIGGINTVSKPKYGIPTSKFNSKIALFHAFGNNERTLTIPKFDNAKKIVLCVSFPINTTIDEKINHVNSIKSCSKAQVPIEVYAVEYRNENSTPTIALNENMIFYLFKRQTTLVIEGEKQFSLLRTRSCTINYTNPRPNAYFYETAISIGKKEVRQNLSSSNVANNFRKLFKRKHYSIAVDDSQQEYANRLFDVLPLFYS